MQRNESKRFVLQAVEDLREPVQPGIVATWVGMEYNVSMSDRACSMELLRCHRQGLLSRRSGKYSLTPKGEQRLSWLRSTL